MTQLIQLIRLTLILMFFLYEDAVAAEENESQCSDVQKQNNPAYGLVNWKYYGGFCYAFFNSARMTWLISDVSCEISGGFLVSIHSLEELNFIRRMVTNQPSNRFWIGLRAKGLHSSYEWSDKTAIDFVNWAKDSDEKQTMMVERCVHLDISTGYFGSTTCHMNLQFICKVKARYDLTTTSSLPATMITLAAGCPDGWHIFDEKCYGFFGLKTEEKETWTNANQKCLEMKATMVSIHSLDEQEFIERTMGKQIDMTWIGFHEIDSSKDRAFHWMDGTTVDFSYWEENQPNNWNNYKEECANIRFRYPHMGKWNDAQCDDLKQSYICQIHIDPKEPQIIPDTDHCSNPGGWLKQSSSCYKIFHGSENNVTWTNALSICRSYGGNLVAIGEFTEANFLRFHMLERQDYFWIGMRNKGKHKEYAWITGPARYSNWDRGQPHEVSDESNCVATDQQGKWSIQGCNENHPFICEIMEGTAVPGPEEEDMAMICPNSSLKWMDYSGKFCYIIELNEEVTWYEAAYRCHLEGGFIASFHSTKEVNTVINQIKDYRRFLHIGLAQKHDGDFGWLDRSPVDFVNWADGQPNSDDKMCVEMGSNSGTWYDASCDDRKGYVCSVAKVPSFGHMELKAECTSSVKGGQLATGVIIGMISCALIVVIVSLTGYYFYYPQLKASRSLLSHELN